MSSKDEFTRHLINTFGDWEGVRREFRRFGRHDESEIERLGTGGVWCRLRVTFLFAREILNFTSGVSGDA